MWSNERICFLTIINWSLSVAVGIQNVALDAEELTLFKVLKIQASKYRGHLGENSET